MAITQWIYGLGNQGKSWALNLRDSGHPVKIVGRLGGKSQGLAAEYGLPFVEMKEAKGIERLALLAPDQAVAQVLSDLQTSLTDNPLVILGHGQSLSKDQLEEKFPHVRFALLAIKGIGSEVRNAYLAKEMLGAVSWTQNPDDQGSINDLAKKLGVTHGPFGVHYRDEYLGDLFAEQSLLCGLIPYVCAEAMELLIRKGIPQRAAYFEIWHELKLISKAMVEAGPEKFFSMISPTAFLGAEYTKNELVDESFKQKLEKIYSNLTNGAFEKYMDEANEGELRRECDSFWKNHPLTQTQKAIEGKEHEEKA